MKVKLQEVLEALEGAGMEIEYYYDTKNQKILMIFDGMVDGEEDEELIEEISYTLSGIAAASMICSKLLFGWSNIFSFRVFYVMSGSMEPAIHENSLVIGKLVPENEELAEGEIYAYQRDGILGPQFIIHRLIREDGEGRYLFQGDANQMPDDRVVERGTVGYRIIWGLGSG